MKLTILIKLTDAIVGLGQVVKTVEVEDGSLIHMETRDPRQDPDVVSMEVLLTVEVTNSLNLIVLTISQVVKERIVHLMKKLRRCGAILGARVVAGRRLLMIIIVICVQCHHHSDHGHHHSDQHGDHQGGEPT